MEFQHTDLLMKLRTVKHAMKPNSTVLLDTLEQANQIFNMFSEQVTAGLYSKTKKLHQVAEELGK